MTSQTFLMTSFVKSFDRKFGEHLTKRSIAKLFFISFKLGKLYCEFQSWASPQIRNCGLTKKVADMRTLAV